MRGNLGFIGARRGALTMALVASTLAPWLAPPVVAQEAQPSRDPQAAQPSAPAPDAATPPGDGSAPPAAPAPAPEPPPPPAPGVVVVVADADDLVAEVGGAIRGLKAGENRIELPAGDHTVVVRTKAGKAIGSYPVQVPSGGEARVQIVSTGVVVVPAREGRVVEVDGKAVEAKDGRYEIRRGAGKVPVVVKEAGKVGRKGEVDILVGKTATLDPTLEAFSAGNKNVALACILGGGALVLGGTLMEVFADADAVGGDGTRWALMGIGTAAFVGGTIWMKDILAKENSPPVQPGTFDVKFAATRGGAAARLTLRF